MLSVAATYIEMIAYSGKSTMSEWNTHVDYTVLPKKKVGKNIA